MSVDASVQLNKASTFLVFCDPLSLWHVGGLAEAEHCSKCGALAWWNSGTSGLIFNGQLRFDWFVLQPFSNYPIVESQLCACAVHQRLLNKLELMKSSHRMTLEVTQLLFMFPKWVQVISLNKSLEQN